jgi:nucleoside phosphorylase
MVGSYRTKAVRCKMGPFGHGGSAAQALMAQKETNAVGLISLGMAFGINRHRQSLGDVLVSTSLLPYDNRTVICLDEQNTDDQITDDFGEMPAYSAAETLLNMLRTYAATGRANVAVQFGAMLTGGARIHCARFRDRLARALSDRAGVVIGGEMEGAGLLSTCPIRRPNWALVKGISDFADQRRKEDITIGRPLACRNSARFLLQAMLYFDPENQSP